MGQLEYAEMKIGNLRIKNFKGFSDSGSIAIGKSTTVIVGENNAGKTAFLDSFSPIQNKPYLEPKTPGQLTPVPNPTSEITFRLVTSGAEILREFLFSGRPVKFLTQSQSEAYMQSYLQGFFSATEINWDLSRTQAGWSSVKNSAHDYETGVAKPYTARVTAAPNKQTWQNPVLHSANQQPEDWNPVVTTVFDNSVFVFRAERLNIATSAISNSPTLIADASNLPSVLMQMQPDTAEQYKALIREIFPNIYGIAARPTGPSQATIFVTNRDSRELTRSAVELPLSECGTGISQVLSILYVVVTAEFSKVIVIDEPNSFLHPGAVRTLLKILQRYDHQYIISTHSSDVISTLNPDLIHFIKWEGNRSAVRTLDHKNASDQQKILRELGSKLSDVFGADHVIWVEGPTEEYCFPLLMAYLRIFKPSINIVPLIATGDLTGKKVRPELVIQIYEQLSKGSALIPPALAICLDRDERSDDELQELGQRSNGVVRFLPRRTYENYLLDAEAIHATLNLDRQAEEKYTLEQVTDWMNAHRTDAAFYSKEGAKRRTAENWASIINAPKFLTALFNELSETTVEFRKTTHSVELTRWLLANRPDVLKELLDYVGSLPRE